MDAYYRDAVTGGPSFTLLLVLVGKRRRCCTWYVKLSADEIVSCLGWMGKRQLATELILTRA